MENKKNIAVIGAGPVGLVALKCLLEQGHDATAYEQQSSIGGLWNYQEEKNKMYVTLPSKPHEYVSGCYYSLIQNTSKIMTQFSDFPAPDSMPQILTHSDYYQYLQDYAKQFCLHEHVKLNTTVTELCHAANSAAVANKCQWKVRYVSRGQTETKIHDLVVVATGKLTCPLIPVYPGMDEFRNTVLHSMQICRDEIFKNKRVLIAGGGFSGTEMICNALNGCAKSVYWTLTGSTKNTDHNHWAFSRLLDNNGKPWDHNITRHGHPDEVFGENGKLSTWLYPLNLSDKHPSVQICTDGFAITSVPQIKSAIALGQVCIVAPITHLKETSIVLSDDTSLDDIDIVVFCTGYTKAFPFLDGLWDKEKQVKAMLHRHMLPAEEDLQGLAFVGMTSSISSLFPIAEMQSRWLAKFWASRTNSDGLLYTEEELCKFEAEIQKQRESLIHRQKFSFLFDPYGYMEELAIELGCRPSVEELQQTDKELAAALMHAPLVSTQYRLVGRSAWPQAREYIIRMAQELRTQ